MAAASHVAAYSHCGSFILPAPLFLIGADNGLAAKVSSMSDGIASARNVFYRLLSIDQTLTDYKIMGDREAPCPTTCSAGFQIIVNRTFVSWPYLSTEMDASVVTGRALQSF